MTHHQTRSVVGKADTAAALAALDRLGDLLARENAALRARDTRILAGLSEEKRAAVAVCERLVAAVAGDDGATPAPAAALVAAKARIVDLLEENQQRLRVAISANQRLVETIAAAAQARTPGADAYASDGRLGLSAGRTTNPPALTLSRAL